MQRWYGWWLIDGRCDVLLVVHPSLAWRERINRFLRLRTKCENNVSLSRNLRSQLILATISWRSSDVSFLSTSDVLYFLAYTPTTLMWSNKDCGRGKRGEPSRSEPWIESRLLVDWWWWVCGEGWVDDPQKDHVVVKKQVLLLVRELQYNIIIVDTVVSFWGLCLTLLLSSLSST